MGKIGKPVIAIIGEDGTDLSGNPNFVIRKAYTDAVEKAGGVPVTILDLRTAADCASYADALLLTDGPVMHPWRYGELIRDFKSLQGFSRTRDDFDFGALRIFEKAGKPVFGIGRGLEVLCAYAGGKIFPGEEGEVPVSGGFRSAEKQKIHAADASLAEEVLSGQQEVRSAAINRIGSTGSLTPTAWTEDGKIAAAQGRDGKLFGVHWNPEYEDDAAGERFFAALVRAAGEKR